MKVGIDISQIAYSKTGVAVYVKNLVDNLLKIDKQSFSANKTNEYVLFASSLRKRSAFDYYRATVCGSNHVKGFPFPPVLLGLLWNKLHILPIEWLIGDVDVFLTSDWVEPPTIKAKKTTILYDLSVFKYPNEMDKKIVEVQKRKLEWVKKETDLIFCISEATKKDAKEILGIEEKRLKVIYPGGI